MPKGMRSKFNLAKQGNDGELADLVQDIMNVQASQVLNSFLETSEKNLWKYENDFYELKINVLRQFGTQLGWDLILNAKCLKFQLANCVAGTR